MTLITDHNGTRWVEPKPRKTRNPPKVRKFADIKVGDQIGIGRGETGVVLNPSYFEITDLWFDPVRGQKDPIKGQMVGFAQIMPDGTLSTKVSTPIRGLASQGYEPADIDYLALCKTRTDAMKSGDVIGIGAGRRIRKRPQTPGL